MRVTLGHDYIGHDTGEWWLIINKMVKVFKQGKLWNKSMDGKMGLAVGDLRQVNKSSWMWRWLLCSTGYYFEKNQEQ